MMVPDWFFLGIGRRRWRIWITVTYGQWYKTDYGSAIGQHMDSTCIQRQSSTFIINTLSATKGVVPFHLSLAMLFLIFVYYLAQGAAIDANPVPSIYNQSIKPNSCKDITHCRTIWNITWGCLTTIFSCAWVAVHPNIPCPRKRQANSCIERWKLTHFGRSPSIDFCRSYVLAWAIIQHPSARKMAKKNKSEFEHCISFWLISRSTVVTIAWIFYGFHLFERSSEELSDVEGILHGGDTHLHPLSAGNLNGDDTTIPISVSPFTVPTGLEIKDRGKRLRLAKSLVLLQTS